MLKNKADLRTLAFMVVTTALLVLNWSLDTFNPWLFCAAMLMAMSVSTITHNHNHVHTDEQSEWNHSRNFTSPVLNGFLFNNGLHTVHHWKAGRHWSQTPALHREVVSKIDPSLNEPSMLWYLVRTYLLAPIVPPLRSRSMRLARVAAETAAS